MNNYNPVALILVTLMSVQSVEAADKAPPAKDTVVCKESGTGTGWQMGMGIAEFPPNSAKPRQQAAGPEVCYVREGEVMVQIAGQPTRTFHAGETFQLPANVVHVTTAGPVGAVVVATWAHMPGKQFNIPVPN